jgi:CP family cyanate transporter-like MFS transporter
LAERRGWAARLVGLTTAGYAAGYLGLLTAPDLLAWLWAALLGLGNGAFPLAVTLIGLRSGQPEVTTALSAFAQSRGYLLASAGPLLVGLVRERSGGWALPLLLVLGAVLAQLVSGLRCAAAGTVESDLARIPTPRHAR